MKFPFSIRLHVWISVKNVSHLTRMYVWFAMYKIMDLLRAIHWLLNLLIEQIHSFIPIWSEHVQCMLSVSLVNLFPWFNSYFDEIEMKAAATQMHRQVCTL